MLSIRRSRFGFLVIVLSYLAALSQPVLRAEGASVIKVTIPDFRIDADGDGMFARDFVLEKPVLLDEITFAHWEQIHFEIRRNDFQDGQRYGSKVDLHLISEGQVIVSPFWTHNVFASGIPSHAQKVRKGFTINPSDGVMIDTIRWVITTPTPIAPAPLQGGLNSQATLRGLGENDALTIRFFKDDTPEGMNRFVTIDSFGPLESTLDGTGPWIVHPFDSAVSTEFLRFVNWDGQQFARGSNCGAMLESQLILDNHSEESPAVILLDDAYSPSQGEPCADAISYTCSKELSSEDHDTIGGRAVVGLRWRLSTLPGCGAFSVVPLFEPSRMHFAYDTTQIDGPSLPRFLRGDRNADGEVNISDATCILNWLFAGGEDPGCVAATNPNGDDAANITDATYLLNHLFSGGPAPAAPFPDCGPDPTTDELSCVAFEGCE